MTQYIDTKNGRWPVTEHEIRAGHPNTLFPSPFEPCEGYAPLVLEPVPAYDSATSRLEPTPPKEVNGQWLQGWEVRPLNPAEIESRAAEIAARLTADKAAVVAAINSEYERRMEVISARYPASERESWPVQTGEARALLADPGAQTPWIDAAAAVRGIDRAELATRIIALDNAYRTVHGTLTGARQRLEDLVGAATSREEVLAVDPLQGWPEEGGQN